MQFGACDAFCIGAFKRKAVRHSWLHCCHGARSRICSWFSVEECQSGVSAHSNARRVGGRQAHLGVTSVHDETEDERAAGHLLAERILFRGDLEAAILAYMEENVAGLLAVRFCAQDYFIGVVWPFS